MKNFKQAFIKGNFTEGGVATLTIVLILTMIFISISIAISRINLLNFKSVEDVRNSRTAYFLTESGIEDTMIQLEENISYSGNPSGENTPIGTYYSNITSDDDVYTLTVRSNNGNTERIVELNITISYELAEVTTKAVYMADFFWISGGDARIRGNVWTNDDYEIVENGIVEGDVTAAGRGSFLVNWVWDGFILGNPAVQGGQVLDNPETPETEGNIVAADTVKVSGPTAYVEGNVTSDNQVYQLLGGTIDGTVTENAGLTWEQIPVPSFDFDSYKALAIQQGTYFSTDNAFENYVDSLDDGNERRLPSDIYYVDDGNVTIDGETPVFLDGLLVVEDELYIQTEWYHTAQNGLPAIVCGDDLAITNKFDFWSWSYIPAGNVRISGIVFAERDINFYRVFADEDIIVDGAAWAGDDTFIETHTFVDYNIDPILINGFDFVSGISDLQKNHWREII